MDYTTLSSPWVLIWAALMFAVQGDTLDLESGRTRGTPAIHVALNNMIEFAGSIALSWAIGFRVICALLQLARFLIPWRVSSADERIGRTVSAHGASAEIPRLLQQMESRCRFAERLPIRSLPDRAALSG